LRPVRKPQSNERGEDREIDCYVLPKIPMLTRVTETTAGDIEAARFGGDGGADENRDERGQDRQSPAVKKPKDDGEAAKDFQPRQVKRESYANEPRQRFVIVDVEAELDRVEHFNKAGINENTADDKIDNSPEISDAKLFAHYKPNHGYRSQDS
jgi:hypothetical protein